MKSAIYSLIFALALVGCGSGGDSAQQGSVLDNRSTSPASSQATTNVTANWMQQAYLKAANSNANQSYGNSVAIDGDTIVVGAIAESSAQTTITNGPSASTDTSVSRAGAAYVYIRDGTSWSQQAYLKAPNAHTISYFGTAVAISADTIAVGAYAEASNQTTITNGVAASSDTSAPGAGAVYIFVRNGNSWMQQAYIKAPNANGGDRFGTSLAIDGDTLVVGAIFEGSNQTTITNGTFASNDNSLIRTGAAYVFTRNGSSWSQQAYLKPPNPDPEDRFGYSVSISGDTIVATSIWEASNQTNITNGATGSSDNSATHAGAAYVFVRSGNNWSQQAYLKATNAEANDAYGASAAISGDTIVIGATGESSNQTAITNGNSASNDNSASLAGAAYVYVRTGSTWEQQAYLKAANAQADNRYGFRVALDGDIIVVGAYQENSGATAIINGSTASNDVSASHSGAAYVYKRTGSTWEQQAYIKAVNSRSNYLFGASVAVKQNNIVIGSILESSSQNFITNGPTASSDTSASSAGAAYVYTYQ